MFQSHPPYWLYWCWLLHPQWTVTQQKYKLHINTSTEKAFEWSSTTNYTTMHIRKQQQCVTQNQRKQRENKLSARQVSELAYSEFGVETQKKSTVNWQQEELVCRHWIRTERKFCGVNFHHLEIYVKALFRLNNWMDKAEIFHTKNNYIVEKVHQTCYKMLLCLVA
jgi:hypothetical protein